MQLRNRCSSKDAMCAATVLYCTVLPSKPHRASRGYAQGLPRAHLDGGHGVNFALEGGQRHDEVGVGGQRHQLICHAHRKGGWGRRMRRPQRSTHCLCCWGRPKDWSHHHWLHSGSTCITRSEFPPRGEGCVEPAGGLRMQGQWVRAKAPGRKVGVPAKWE